MGFLRRGLAAALVTVGLACASNTRPTDTEEPPRPPNPTPLAVTGCGLPPSGPWQHCPYELPAFAHDVNQAIAEVENEVPELFDFDDHLGGLSYRVLDRRRYHEEVVKRLEKMGFCAVWDGEEVGLKNVNAFNEQYQVMTSLGYARWGAGAYRSTCYPAWF